MNSDTRREVQGILARAIGPIDQSITSTLRKKVTQRRFVLGKFQFSRRTADILASFAFDTLAAASNLTPDLERNGMVFLSVARNSHVAHFEMRPK